MQSSGWLALSSASVPVTVCFTCKSKVVGEGKHIRGRWRRGGGDEQKRQTASTHVSFAAAHTLSSPPTKHASSIPAPSPCKLPSINITAHAVLRVVGPQLRQCACYRVLCLHNTAASVSTHRHLPIGDAFLSCSSLLSTASDTPSTPAGLHNIQTHPSLHPLPPKVTAHKHTPRLCQCC
jgi:hypothetical protein